VKARGAEVVLFGDSYLMLMSKRLN